MKLRTTVPKNNKYYIRQVTGGLNGAVAGDPMQKYANVLDNCVGFANGRYNEIWNDPDLKGVVKRFNVQLVCNAENFIESAKKQGLKISSTPIEGGIMVWQKGATLSGGDGAGHVEVVEEVYTDGSILCSSSGWKGWDFRLLRRYNTNGRWGQNSAYRFRGCIINPSIKNPKVVPAPKLIVDGSGGPATVRALQKFLGVSEDGVISNQIKSSQKYFASLKSVTFGKGGSNCVRKLQKWLGIKEDGYWGPGTSKALQRKLGVTADGYFGTASMKALQKYLNSHDKADFTAANNAVLKPISAPSKPSVASKAVQINNAAIDLSWPVGTNPSKYAYKGGSACTNFKNAWKKYFPKKKNNAGCHQFVMLVLKVCGYPTMDISSWSKILSYLRKNFNEIKPTYKESQLQAGDIGVYKRVDSKGKSHYHIWVIVKVNGKLAIAEAQQSKNYSHINTSLKKALTKHSSDYIFRAK